MLGTGFLGRERILGLSLEVMFAWKMENGIGIENGTENGGLACYFLSNGCLSD